MSVDVPTVADPFSADLPGPAARTVYAHVARHGRVAVDRPGVAAIADVLALTPGAVERAIDDLQDLLLLTPVERSGRAAVDAVDPDVAAAALIAPVDADVHRGTVWMDRVQHELAALRPHYGVTPGAAPASPADRAEGAREVTALHALWGLRATTDIVRLCPSTTSDLVLWLGTGRRAGVRTRLLVPHAARTIAYARAEMDALERAGTQVRTAAEVPAHVTVYDGRTVIVTDTDDAGRTVATVLHDQATVRALLALAEHAWSGGEACTASQPGYGVAVGDLHRALLQMLADGLVDEAIARRLGISVRTCRRHIAVILRELGAVSRFQAGVRAHAAGLTRRGVVTEG